MKSKKRGMFLEKILNKTINFYEQEQLALFHKKNVDIIFQSVSQNNNALKLENAFLSRKSTVDYYGVYQGKFIAFEAKSVEGNLLPFKNIPPHQINYLDKVIAHGGIGFFIIFFKESEKFFLLDHSHMQFLYHNQKSLSFNKAEQLGYQLELYYPGILDFLPIIKKHFQKNF